MESQEPAPEDAAAVARYNLLKEKERAKNRRYYQSRREELSKRRVDRSDELHAENILLRDRVEELEQQLSTYMAKDRIVSVSIEQLYNICRSPDAISSI